MPTPSSATLLTYANLQLAAEAFLNDPEPYLDQLTTGNNRSSRFTNTDSAQFAREWTVVAHQANTSTGFSGTVFRYEGVDDPSRGLVRGQLVMSFRSTEFVDDAARDNQETNRQEIQPFGWAFGQIADMENWYASLTAPGGALAGHNFTVTGYSLGGHLATAFNLLHGGEGRIDATYTFNGAGVGTVAAGSQLGAIVANFDRQRRNADGQQITLSDPQAQNFYLQMRSRFTGGIAPTLTEIEQALQVTANPQEGRLLHDAMQRIRDVVLENQRVRGLNSGSADSPAPSVPADSAIEATRLDYQLAVLIAARSTASTNTTGSVLGRVSGPYTLANFYDVVGDISPSAVANSQLHYGTATPVFIEDQPTWRGSVLSDAAAQSAAYADIKLLVNNFGQNDFGDTHSLVLIVDSLAVQNTLARLMPSVDQATLNTVLQSASNLTRITGGGDGNQGRAEGDVLENVVNALSRVFLGPDATPLVARTAGGTWADITDRNRLHDRLALIEQSAAFTAAAGHVTLTATAGQSSLPTQARQDFAAFLSLFTLSPFALRAASEADQTALNSALMAQWPALQADWVADRDAIAAGRSAQNFSDVYLGDRQAMLQWEMVRNLGNVEGVVNSSAPNGAIYTDAASGTVIRTGSYTDLQRQPIWFGGNDAESFSGNGQADHLYGGAGTDTLRGLGGADWLEGQSGADRLEGGAGNDTLLGGTGDDILEGGADNDLLRGGAQVDTYRFSGAFGADVIEDSDGQGSIEVGSLGALGANTVRVSDTAWQSADGRVRYVRMPAAQADRYDLVITVAAGADVGTITVRNWNPGDLGLSVPSSAAPGSFVHTVYGDFIKRLTEDGYMYDYADGNYVADGPAPNAQDVLEGRYGEVADALYGLGGNDGLYGGGGNDWLDGGAGNDPSRLAAA